MIINYNSTNGSIDSNCIPSYHIDDELVKYINKVVPIKTGRQLQSIDPATNLPIYRNEHGSITTEPSKLIVLKAGEITEIVNGTADAEPIVLRKATDMCELPNEKIMEDEYIEKQVNILDQPELFSIEDVHEFKIRHELENSVYYGCISYFKNEISNIDFDNTTFHFMTTYGTILKPGQQLVLKPYVPEDHIDMLMLKSINERHLNVYVNGLALDDTLVLQSYDDIQITIKNESGVSITFTDFTILYK